MTTNWVRVNPTPAMIADKIDKYFIRLPRKPKTKSYSISLSKVSNAFRLPNVVRPLHIQDVIREYPNPDKSPGLPYTRMGYRRKDEVDPRYIKTAAHLIKTGRTTKWHIPCNGVAKTIVAKTPKIRLIWVYPTEMTFIEGSFAIPLIGAYQTYDHSRNPYAIWVQYGRGHMKKIAKQLPPKWRWLACDWSSFDTNVPAWLIRDAFSILRENIDWSGNYQTAGFTNPLHLERMWKSIIDYFINTPIKYPDGSVKVKRSGVPSGSYFTNLLDTIINAIVITFLLDIMKVVTGYRLYMGDDSLVACKNKTVNLDRMAELALATFGFTMSTTKTSYSEQPMFLGFTITRMGTPETDYDKLAAQMCLPSYPDKCVEDTITRARALRLASLGANRRFDEEITRYLNSFRVETKLHYKSELRIKLMHLGIDVNMDYNVLYSVVH